MTDDILPKGYRLSLAWIAFFSLSPILLGWSFAMLGGCGGGSACYVEGINWAATGDVAMGLPAFTTPIGVAALMVWVAAFAIRLLRGHKAPAIGRRHDLPYHLYLVVLFMLSIPPLLAAVALWLGSGVGVLPGEIASSIGLAFAKFWPLNTFGMLIWLVVFLIHLTLDRLAAGRRRPRGAFP